MNLRTRIALSIGVLGAALAIAVPAFSTGVASHDLKKNNISARLVTSGVDSVSVTCPDGGVALTKGVQNTDIFAEPFYYHTSGSVSESGHVVTATLGADWNDSTEVDVTLYVTCVSLDS